MPNKLFPKADAAQQMLERAMLEFTGETDLGKAFARFVHKDDKVAVKLNGIAAQSGAAQDQVVVTTGSQQALDLLAHALCDPGDVVVVEHPAYLGAIQALEAAGARLEPVASDAHGLRVDELEARLAAGLRPSFEGGQGDLLPFLLHSHDMYVRWGATLADWLRGAPTPRQPRQGETEKL